MGDNKRAFKLGFILQGNILGSQVEIHFWDHYTRTEKQITLSSSSNQSGLGLILLLMLKKNKTHKMMLTRLINLAFYYYR